MKDRKVLGVPMILGLILIGVCLIGIIIGSFLDFEISQVLSNKTDIGTWFANYGGYFSYCLYPAAGMCLFKGLRSKNKKWYKLAWGLLILSYFLAVYYCNSYFGKSIRALFEYEAGVSPVYISILSYLLWIVLLAWVPPVMNKLLGNKNPDLLIAVGGTIIVAGLLSDYINVWLKQVGSRPRYKYLITLDNPEENFRTWWHMIPNLAGSNDSFKSWPSGNMTIATMMYSLPLLATCFKKKNNLIKYSLFSFASIWVILYGYNRIHMGAHFLTDVCFGTLITYLIYVLCDYIAISKNN